MKLLPVALKCETAEDICRELMAKSAAAELMLARFTGETLVHAVARHETPQLFNPWARAPRASSADPVLAGMEGRLMEGLDIDNAWVGDSGVLMVRAGVSSGRAFVRLLMPVYAARIRRVLEVSRPTATYILPGTDGGSGAPAHTGVFAPFPTDRRRLS